MPDEIPDGSSAAPANSWFARCTKRIRWMVFKTFRWLVILFGAWVALILVGLIPVNNGFRPDPDGIEILVMSSAVHADIVVPIRSNQCDWSAELPSGLFRGDTSEATHVAFGWGDRGFFLDTPTWADMKLSTALHALFWPSRTCMQVTRTDIDWWRPHGQSIRISPTQHERLIAFIESGFQRDANGNRMPIPGRAYGQDDVFFEATGSYHCFNTCNSWVGRGLKAAGVRVGWSTPLPKTVFFWLPKE